MSLLRGIAYAALIAFGVFVVSLTQPRPPITAENNHIDIVVAQPQETKSLSFPEAANAPPQKQVAKKSPLSPLAGKLAVQKNNTPASQSSKNENDTEAMRIQNPYTVPSLSDEVLNNTARASLVNVFCTLDNGESVSGSGVFIDSRGVILTNAHIAQYVLLSETTNGISCVGRSGAPAHSAWKLRVIFMPSKWVDVHAQDLHTPKPTGTGEHDYGLLLAETFPQTSPNTISPALFDTREAVAFTSDQVLLASYPAGFLGAMTVQNNLFPATTFAHIGHLYTFTEKSIDLFSLGGTILAQGGSSGGMVMNQWGQLVGIIVTTSDGETTAQRDLRAITLAHINRSIKEHTGMSLSDYIGTDLEVHASDFRKNDLPALAQKLIKEIPKQ